MKPNLSVRATLLFSSLILCGPLAAADYRLGPDSLPHDGVPAGRVEKFELNDSKIFLGTRRDCWVYLPANLNPSRPLALMVFQDGHAYVGTNGEQRVPVVFDNLIHKGDMPPTAALFLNPGDRSGAELANGWSANNRSVEYDSLGDAYARFLLEEAIPEMTNRFHLSLDPRPEMRAICGMSSGGICAWTAAWERSDAFGKVLSQIGSFVNIRGGHAYAAILRKNPRKPIRVFLQDGVNDLNNEHGNWPLANLELASSLAYVGYDFDFVLGEGTHSGRHGGAILPDSLRWLWRHEAPAALQPVAGEDSIAKVAAGGGEANTWEVVGEGYGFTDAACADADGNFYFSDLNNAIVYRVPPGGKPKPWLRDGLKISGLKPGPGGRFYAALQGGGADKGKRIIAINPATGAVEDLAVDVAPNDLAVSRAGFVYYTDTAAGQVVRVPVGSRSMSRPPPVAGGIRSPNGIALSADQHWLMVSEYSGANLWRFKLSDDGAVRGGERLGVLRIAEGKTDSAGDGMTMDADGRSYVTTRLGIQVFEVDGRPAGVLAPPQNRAMVSCAFAGPDFGYLYACCSDKVFRHKMVARGAAPLQ